MVEFQLQYPHIGVLVGKGEYPREIHTLYAKTIFESVPETAKTVALSLETLLSCIQPQYKLRMRNY